MKWNLLEKTTFWVEGVNLINANLKTISNAVAKVLELDEKDIMVVDVRNGLVAFDVLKQDILPKSIVGKGKQLISCLKDMPEVLIDNSATIHSEGILGLIAMEPKESEEFLVKSSQMADEVLKRINKRAIIFASGSEILNKNVQDTNSPYLVEMFNREGFNSQYGGILPDDTKIMSEYLNNALNEGFGTIVVTGGTGAEDKDFTVEAIKKLDPKASTPYILRFHPGTHRHYHDGVKIAVGEVGITKIIALPGPHEEVELISKLLINGVKNKLNKYAFSQILASPLRKRWERITKRRHER